VLEVLDLQLAQLLAPQRVIEQGREDGAITLFLDGFFAGRGVLAGRHEQVAGLVVAERRRLAFAALGPGPLHPLDRIVGDGIFLTEIFKQRRQRRVAMPDGGATELAPRQVVAPGNDMRPGYGAEFLRAGNASELHEVVDRVFIRPAGAPVAEIGEPLDLGRHVREAVKLLGSQEPFGRGDFGRQLGIGHGGDFNIDKICNRLYY